MLHSAKGWPSSRFLERCVALPLMRLSTLCLCGLRGWFLVGSLGHLDLRLHQVGKHLEALFGVLDQLVLTALVFGSSAFCTSRRTHPEPAYLAVVSLLPFGISRDTLWAGIRLGSPKALGKNTSLSTVGGLG